MVLGVFSNLDNSVILFSTDEFSPELLGPVKGYPEQEKHGAPEVSPSEGLQK